MDATTTETSQMTQSSIDTFESFKIIYLLLYVITFTFVSYITMGSYSVRKKRPKGVWSTGASCKVISGTRVVH